jgi:hypothetical protein|tara:strand:+ start:2865 stop:3011 length:147 start_codon:yes stop_codon:yes gene_type:complete
MVALPAEKIPKVTTKSIFSPGIGCFTTCDLREKKENINSMNGMMNFNL